MKKSVTPLFYLDLALKNHQESNKLKTRWFKTFSISIVSAAIICGCGGGDNASSAALIPSPDPVPTPSPAPQPAPLTTCYDGGVGNSVGLEDPLYANAWHLKNTGSAQVVSAINNQGMAGIDANVENAHKAGRGCTGAGVTIAIVDTGLEIGHEDLRDNVLAGKSFNFADNTSEPSPPLKQNNIDHGTGVAGVAAARGWNGKGSRGTAPFASLVAYPLIGVSPLPDTDYGDMQYLAFGAAALADATANVVPLFGKRADTVSVFNFSAGADYGAPTIVDDTVGREIAAAYGARKLRGGLGAVYFQAAGNEENASQSARLPDGSYLKIECADVLAADASVLRGRISSTDELTCGSPNHEPAGKPYFYQVASINNTGRASSYSSSGAVNWITGFGGEYGGDEAAIIATDNSGCDSGVNNIAQKPMLFRRFGEAVNKLVADLLGASAKDPDCNYTGRMNGTSAATPSISGVAALLLEANPRLTWQDVGYIMAKTARKVDADVATGRRAVTFTPTGGTAQNMEEPWLTNRAGFNFQNQYGFGLVDADAAVRLAASYTAPSGRRNHELIAEGNAAISTWVNQIGVNQATVNFVNGPATSGQMRLDLTVINNTGGAVNPGQLQFEITNRTTGTKSILLPAFTAWYVGGKDFKIPPRGQQDFRMHTNAFYGENMAGDYVVTVYDFSGASGAAGKSLNFKPKLTSFSM